MAKVVSHQAPGTLHIYPNLMSEICTLCMSTAYPRGASPIWPRRLLTFKINVFETWIEVLRQSFKTSGRLFR